MKGTASPFQCLSPEAMWCYEDVLA